MALTRTFGAHLHGQRALTVQQALPWPRRRMAGALGDGRTPLTLAMLMIVPPLPCFCIAAVGGLRAIKRRQQIELQDFSGQARRGRGGHPPAANRRRCSPVHRCAHAARQNPSPAFRACAASRTSAAAVGAIVSGARRALRRRASAHRHRTPVRGSGFGDGAADAARTGQHYHNDRGIVVGLGYGPTL